MLDQIKALVKDKGIEYFFCSFVEMSGAPKAKLVPATHLDDMASEGAGYTFMNKLDRPTKDPLELLDELEHVLGIQAYPMNFPLGTGFEFRGVYDRRTKFVHLFELIAGGAFRAPVEISGLSDPVVSERLTGIAYAKVTEEIEMLDHAGAAFDAEKISTGKLTPVFFGSARNNFGVQLLLDGFLEHAGPPRPRVSNGTEVPLDGGVFSGFIFKIQANMDPKHRDRVAFVRVCSGKFERDMSVTHSRTQKKVRLSNSSKLFGRERETIDEAYPGDIVGFVGMQNFGIGDTLSEDEKTVYHEIPHFPPEVFASLSNPNPSNFKKFREGLEQLLQEGVVQGLQRLNSAQRIPLLAAVGPLQFEVVQYRLESEYGAESKLEQTDWKLMRWIHPSHNRDAARAANLPSGSELAENDEGALVVLFKSEWALNYFVEKNLSIKLSELPWSAGQEPLDQAR